MGEMVNCLFDCHRQFAPRLLGDFRPSIHPSASLLGALFPALLIHSRRDFTRFMTTILTNRAMYSETRLDPMERLSDF
jgi:hypothetical protein